jgi:hypothetical protein
MNPQNPPNFEQQGQSPNDTPKAPQNQFKRVLDARTMKILEGVLSNTPPRLLPIEIEEEILSHSDIALRYALHSYKKTIPFK